MYKELQEAYSSLKDDYDVLESSHYELQEAYSSLKDKHDTLESNYTELLKSHQALQDEYEELVLHHELLSEELEASMNELSLKTNILYAVSVTTILFIATTIYFARRRKTA